MLAREGIEGATVRAVAAEAGWTRGIVEHYFASKEEMLLYACRLGCERALAQVQARHRTLVGREALRGVLLHDMALRGERREAAGAWFGLLAAAAHEPALAAELVRFDAAVRTVLAEIISEMIARGEAAADLDADDVARSILGFNLRLNMNVRMQPESYPDAVVAAEVEGFLERLTRAPRGPAAAE